MSQYLQLLGTDTPNSYGGCCYYGTLENPALETTTAFKGAHSSTTTTATTAAGKAGDATHPTHQTRMAWQEFLTHIGCKHGLAHAASASLEHDTTAAANKEASNAPNAATLAASVMASGATKNDGYLLFNCPEGTQRFSSEANIKLTKVKGFFFTRWGRHCGEDLSSEPSLSPGDRNEESSLADSRANDVEEKSISEGSGSAVMGLPGLLFTINDAGVRQANFFGPSTSRRAATYLRQCLAKPSTTNGEAAAAHAIPSPLVRLHGATGSQSSGLERFLHVLRGSYFFYRDMTFRQLTPLYLASPRWQQQRYIKERSDSIEGVIMMMGGGTLREGAGEEEDPAAEAVSAFPAQDEAFPLLTLTDAYPHSPSTPFGSNTPFHIVAVLPLSTSSLLLAFRTSASDKGTAWNPGDTSGDVFSYAIVNAPPPSFDAAKAKALGVRPGPKYALLKQGIPVYADTAAGDAASDKKKKRGGPKETPTLATAVTEAKPTLPTPAACDRADENTENKRPRTEAAPSPPAQAASISREGKESLPPRLVYPHEVSRTTLSSKETFVSLILDSNAAEDLRGAMEALFLPRAISTANTTDAATQGEELQNLFERIVAAQSEDLMFYRADEEEEVPAMARASGCGTPPPSSRRRRKRRVVVRQVVHVQPSSYFSKVAQEQLSQPTGTDEHSVLARYLAFVFGNVAKEDHMQLSLEPTVHFATTASADPSDTRQEASDPSTTLHLFTASVQRDFTAFPTALAHRYHLNAIAPHCFPVAAGLCNGSPLSPASGSTIAGSSSLASRSSDVYWPYSFKFQCIEGGSTDGAKSTHVKKAKNSIHGEHDGESAASSTVMAPARIPWYIRRQLVPEGATGAYLRYPTAETALGMLSGTFRCRLSSRKGVPPESISSLTTTVRSSESAPSNGTTGAREDGGGALVFTGTGSAVPSKYRNVSGTLLEVHTPAYCLDRTEPNERHGGHGDNKNRDTGNRQMSDALMSRGVFVLDFGEGSLGQLKELFRAEAGSYPTSPPFLSISPRLTRYLLDVELIFISHGHADHHLGLLSLLHARHQCLAQEMRAGRACEGCKGGCVREGIEGSQDARCSPLRPRRALTKKLLIVMPAEVFYFMHYGWFTAEPYRRWVYEECEFDILPSVSLTHRSPHHHRHNHHDDDIEDGEAEEEEEALHESDEEKRNKDGGRGTGTKSQDLPVPSHTEKTAPEEEGGDASRNEEEDKTFRASLCATNPSPLSLGFPRLLAQCQHWNAVIQRAHGPCDSPAAPRKVGHAVPPKAAANKLWDADIFTVDHPANAHAILLRFPFLHDQDDGVLDSKVFLFSGDTRPSETLVQRCHRFCQKHLSVDAETTTVSDFATVKPSPEDAISASIPKEGLFICLHEATFGPGYEADAIRKKHSTLPEALDIGARTHSQFVVLNHFSQRYPKLPGLTEEHLDGSTVDLECKKKAAAALARREQQQPSEHQGLASPTGSVTSAGANNPRDVREVPHAVPESTEGKQRTPAPSCSPQGPQHMCFAFDLMRLPFSAVQDGSVARLLPTFVRLLEEYESWGVGTTQRLRE